MNPTINSENEIEFHFILNVVKEIRTASKRPDNQITRFEIRSFALLPTKYGSQS